MKRALIAFMLATLTACSREPRSTSYFAAHPADAAKVLANCRAGAHRGAECDNALAAKAAADAKAREDLFRRGFR
jgi:hypothetical protein